MTERRWVQLRTSYRPCPRRRVQGLLQSQGQSVLISRLAFTHRLVAVLVAISALRGIIGNLGQATRGKQQGGFPIRRTRAPFYGGGLPPRPTPLTSVLRESICSQDPQIA